MKYDLARLQNGIEKEILIQKTYSFTKEELKGTEILSLDNLKIEGIVKKDSLGELTLFLTLDGTMVLPCAITLKPVDYPFHIEIDGNIQELEEEMEEKMKKDENTLDIFPIIWENILMEIPMRVTSKDAEKISLKGDGWELLKEEDAKKNLALQDMKDYL